MVPEKPGPDLIRAGYRCSEKIMPKHNLERDGDSKKSHIASALHEAIHAGEDIDAFPLQAAGLVVLDPGVGLRQEQRLLIASSFLVLAQPARRFLHRAEVIVVEQAVELGEIDVGDAPA